MKIIQLTFLSSLTLLIASCATTESYKTIEDVNNYRVHGRSAIKSPQESGQVSFSITEKNNNQVDITIQGAFAQGKIKMSIKDGFSTLTSQGKTYTGKTPDELFYNVTHMNWPLSGTQKWLEGKPDPINVKNLVLDNQGRPRSFTEDGWSIVYNDWMPVKNLTLPKSMTITRGDEIRIRLIIENWVI